MSYADAVARGPIAISFTLHYPVAPPVPASWAASANAHGGDNGNWKLIAFIILVALAGAFPSM